MQLQAGGPHRQRAHCVTLWLCCTAVEDLPHKDGKLLRPGVVWFNEVRCMCGSGVKAEPGVLIQDATH